MSNTTTTKAAWFKQWHEQNKDRWFMNDSSWGATNRYHQQLAHDAGRTFSNLEMLDEDRLADSELQQFYGTAK